MLRTVCTEYQEINTGNPNLNTEIFRLSEYFKPELVFIQIQSPGITQESLAVLKQNGAFILNWSGDVREPLPEIYKEMAKYVDITCFSNMNDVETMRSLGFKSEYLQIGIDPLIYTPIGHKVSTPEIVFMGNNCGGFPLSGLRQEMVVFLQSNYKNRFGVYGSGWLPNAGNYMGDQLGEASIYRGAKIAVNLSHFDYNQYSSDRLFRALGSGVMVLSHNFQGIDDMFENRVHLSKWNALPGLKQQIDYYLQKDGERQAIAAAGHQLALEKYTFLEMCRNIILIYQTNV